MAWSLAPDIKTSTRPSDLSIVLLRSKPLVHDELELLVGLDVPDDDGAAEPGGVLAATRVVVPDMDVVQIAERPGKESVQCWTTADDGCLGISLRTETPS